MDRENLVINKTTSSGQKVRFGTSSFSSKDWVGTFYPESCKPSEFLRHYATQYDTVEVDSTYYAIPPISTARAWVDKTPDHFLFSLKFPRAIVHGGKQALPDPDVVLLPDRTYADRDRFLAVADELGSRKGPLILQFPYFSRKVFNNRDAFFKRLDRFLADLPTDHRYGVEIRNRTWLTADLVEMCRSHGASLVMVDHAWMPVPWDLAGELRVPTTDFAYVRLLGDRKEIEAITTTWSKEVIDRDTRLERWADYLLLNLEQHVTTLVYINNHYAGHAPATLNKLKSIFERKAARKG
jgi:uncharacterized protein YecE (DUF72 family)